MTKEIWDRYASAWALDDAKSLEELRASLEPEIRYSEPSTVFSGIEAFADYMSRFCKKFPNHKMVVKTVKEHHGFSLARWDIFDGIGRTIISGLSFGIYSSNGKLMAIAAFYGDLSDIIK
jgi:hypothetical protein